LREYWWEIKPVIDPFQVALSLMNHLPRDELLAALRYRAVEVHSAAEARKLAMQTPWMDVKPRHVAELFRLAAAQAEAELRWIEEASRQDPLADVASGRSGRNCGGLSVRPSPRTSADG
jgi:hypothetical protein